MPGLQVSQHIQREHLLTIFEHIPAGSVSMDPTGRILAVNPAFEQYVSRPSEVLAGERFADVFPGVGASLQVLIDEVRRLAATVEAEAPRSAWRSPSGWWKPTAVGLR